MGMSKKEAPQDVQGPSSRPPFPKAPNTWKWAAIIFAAGVIVVGILVWASLR